MPVGEEKYAVGGVSVGGVGGPAGGTSFPLCGTLMKPLAAPGVTGIVGPFELTERKLSVALDQPSTFTFDVAGACEPGVGPEPVTASASTRLAPRWKAVAGTIAAMRTFFTSR